MKLLCEIAGIPRSSYYKWRSSKPSYREQENVELTHVVMSIYEKVERTFGYRQLTLHIRRQTGKTINQKRVYRLMKVKGIQSVIRRKKKKYASSIPQQVAENVLDRKFTADAPNEKLLQLQHLEENKVAVIWIVHLLGFPFHNQYCD
ncbi:IS3 family transposase [Paenibacillus thiaminolyticus]|uniref:IS3 family transposase n=1 Tax=Paenibacillus thiaminolyticus TaxID=49283 RepID=UPI0035A67B04